MITFTKEDDHLKYEHKMKILFTECKPYLFFRTKMNIVSRF